MPTVWLETQEILNQIYDSTNKALKVSDGTGVFPGGSLVHVESAQTYSYSPIPAIGIANAQDLPGMVCSVTPVATMQVEVTYRVPLNMPSGNFTSPNFNNWSNVCSLIDKTAFDGGATLAASELDEFVTPIGTYGLFVLTGRAVRTLTANTEQRYKLVVWTTNVAPTTALVVNASATRLSTLDVRRIG